MIKSLCVHIKKHKKKITTIFLLLIIFLGGCLVVKNSINNIIADTVELKSKALATKAMNSAIADVVINSIVYEDLVNIIR